MGVHSLWDIVGPAARPVKLEALSRKRLAVDASIWIYQFMKAVRDKEGNSLGQTHIVGFFRRICKMLFFGILPLFVFDGGAPPLKRQVIQARKERRQGNRENAANAAQKLLAMQLHRKTGTERTVPQKNASAKKKINKNTASSDEPLYFDDLPMHHTERPQAPSQAQSDNQSGEHTKAFRKKDEYHLPELKQFTVRKGDQRIMPEGELEEYADDHSWDVVDGISIDSVDPSSAEFAELPMSTQYMILSHLRLRSRLRLGYSKDQLEHLFPNSRDFSKFQIQQVQKRNYYTQKLMNVSGMGEDSGNVTRRIAGDKDRQYMLVKNDGGWTLSLGGDQSEEIVELDDEEEVATRDLKGLELKKEDELGESDDDDCLEDVPLETANSLELIGSTNSQRGSLEGDDDDDLVSKAVIESIYDQFKHEFEDSRTLQNSDGLVQQRIEAFRETDLKRAIEESKKDYYQQKFKEDALVSNDKGTQSDIQGFELGRSLLFGSAGDNETHHNNSEEKAIEVEDESDGLSASNKEPDIPQRQPIPLWFNDSSNIQNPHALIGFLLEKKQAHFIDENEEAGLIPWKEAKEYFEQTAQQDADQSDGLEKEEGDDSGSDLEILEDVQIVHNDETGAPKGEAEKRAEADSTKKIGPKSNFLENHGISKWKNIDPRKVFVQKPRVQSKRGAKRKLSPQVSATAASKILPLVAQSNDTTTPSEGTSNLSKTEKQPTVLDYDFDESEEEDLVQQLREEEHEHAQFTSSIQMDKVPIHSTVSNEQLLQEQLQKAKRDAEEVTQTMINDVQELLKRFGIPYITAPMEAEAQCAELYNLGLVDGIVTDDSDCFLFGGSRIYKNMFNQKQFVECYIADDIEHKVGLNQTKLIELALLLGSDYTEGVKGIGPVLAMEILAEFGSLAGFKKWFDETTKTLKKKDDATRTKLEKTLMARIKNGKLFLADTFPDHVVVDAYRRPEVDHDKSEFKWGVPLLDQIRSFLMYNVGWTQEKVDEVMVPLIRNINKTRTEGTQTTIGEFFPQEYISYKKDVGMGKRMKAAANRIRGE